MDFTNIEINSNIVFNNSNAENKTILKSKDFFPFIHQYPINATQHMML